MRNTKNINRDWIFTMEEPSSLDIVPEGIEVSLPHTWNKYDGQDGGADYRRGKGWYVKELKPFEMKPGERLYIELEGVANKGKVFVNGKEAVDHNGGFSAWRKDITEYVQPDQTNIIAIEADNTPYSDVYPAMADFTFYGGAYRDVNLITVPETHFDLDYKGGPGLSVSTKIEGKDALVTIHAFAKNAGASDRVEFEIKDADGKVVAAGVQPASEDTAIELPIANAHLWQGTEDPYLYTVEARLMRANDVLDEVSARLGVREFVIDPARGFFLNGVLTPLRGVSRHQDKMDLGNALSAEDHELDAKLIKDLGANTIRLAHYQHDQKFYDLCDENGFVVWAEIPFISRMSDDPKAFENAKDQMEELIIQNYNHPSIATWGISNEITIGGENPELTRQLKELNNIVHELDETRPSVMAQVSPLPMESEHNQISDVVSYNHYFGWYGGDLEDNEKWLDAFHEKYPDRPLGISEYGCEGITTYHNDEPKRGDYSEDYQAKYHEHMAKIIDERPWLWATHVWNMFDFGCDARDEGGVAGRNNKGLMTLDRKTKKDSYYVYKAYWSKEPFVWIAAKRYAQRNADAIDLKVYTNQPEVTLYQDGKEIATEKGDKVIVFKDVKLKDGFNTFTARAGDLEDTAVFEKVAEPNESYIFVDPNPAGVTNWFDDKDMDNVPEMTFNEGFYSVQDKINDLLDNEEAAEILANGLSSMTGMNIKATMLRMMGDNTLPEMAKMRPASNDEEAKKGEQMLRFINAELQKIKK